MELLSIISELESLESSGLSLPDTFVRLFLAAVLGMAIGIERSRREQSAGMRTYAVVSMASALIMIVSIYGLPVIEGSTNDTGRIAAQVVSGIGFLGAGVIFMRRNVVHGLTTAALLWAASGIGLAVGGGLLITGTIATGLALLITGGLLPVKRAFFQHDTTEHRVRLHLSDPTNVIREIRKIAMEQPAFSVSSLDLESTVDKKKTTLEIRLNLEDADDAITVIHKLEKIAGVDRIGWHAGSLD